MREGKLFITFVKKVGIYRLFMENILYLAIGNALTQRNMNNYALKEAKRSGLFVKISVSVGKAASWFVGLLRIFG